MELQEFIAGTLEGIAKGIEEAKGRVSDIAIVNPSTGQFHTDKSLGSYKIKGDDTDGLANTVHMIDFDIAVTAGTEVKGSGKVGIKVLELLSLAEVEGDVAKKNNTVSRVKFGVPLELPATKTESE